MLDHYELRAVFEVTDERQRLRAAPSPRVLSARYKACTAEAAGRRQRRPSTTRSGMKKAQTIRILSATPAQIESLAQGLSSDQLRQTPAAHEWSISEIVRHLLLGERDVVLPRLRRMREENAPVFQSSLVDQTGFAGDPIPDGFDIDLRAFRIVRGETLAFLRTLTEHDWQRLGTTPTRGTLSIEEYTAYLACFIHERAHPGSQRVPNGA